MSPLRKRPVPRGQREPQGPLARAWRFLSQDIWMIELGSLGGLRALATRVTRVIVLTVRGFVRDRCMQQAAALTYITIFSFVPLLAFLAALAKSVGAYAFLRQETIEPFLDRTFGPAAADPAVQDRAGELRGAIERVLGLVEDSRLTAMGAFGLVLLIYLVVKMLSSVERALNDIWGVSRARGIVRKVADYLAIVVVAPALLTIGASLTLFLKGLTDRVLPANPVLALVPLVAVCGGMGFVLFTLPNTSVRVSSALLGGAVAGLLWQLVQILHVEGQIAMASLSPIYSSFAALPLLLLWIYSSWLIFLLGAELSCAYQNEPVYASLQRTGVVDQAFREALAPRLAGRIVHAFLRNQPAPSAAQLAAETSVSPRAALQVLDVLVEHGLLARTEQGEDEAYLPAHDPAKISLVDLLAALRIDPAGRPVPVTNGLDERADRLLLELEAEAQASTHNFTLVELARLLDAPGAAGGVEAPRAPQERAAPGEERARGSPAV